jgi:hypothetical protein
MPLSRSRARQERGRKQVSDAEAAGTVVELNLLFFVDSAAPSERQIAPPSRTNIEIEST